MTTTFRDTNHGTRIRDRRGFTLLELIVAATILSILTLMALPLAARLTFSVKERNSFAEHCGKCVMRLIATKTPLIVEHFKSKWTASAYPPDLDTLVKGVEGQAAKKTRYLRSIPIDPMTKSKEWGLRSMQDDPDSDSWGGQNVFDVYTKSEGTGLDGTKYKDW